MQKYLQTIYLHTYIPRYVCVCAIYVCMYHTCICTKTALHTLETTLDSTALCSMSEMGNFIKKKNLLS